MAGAGMIGAATCAHAQLVAVNQKFAVFSVLSRKLLLLYDANLARPPTAPAAASAAARIAAPAAASAAA